MNKNSLSDIINRRIKIELYREPKFNSQKRNNKYSEIQDKILLPYAEKFLRSRGILNDVINGFNDFYRSKAETLQDVVFSERRIFSKLLLSNGFRWSDSRQGYDFWEQTNNEYERYMTKIASQFKI